MNKMAVGATSKYQIKSQIETLRKRSSKYKKTQISIYHVWILEVVKTSSRRKPNQHNQTSNCQICLQKTFLKHALTKKW